METVSKYLPKNTTKSFQIRWNEPLGTKENTYAYRWVFIFFGYSIRIHHWLSSDDLRHFHNHAWWFITFVIKGSYIDISENGEELMPTFKLKYRKANHAHAVKIEKECWTILLTGRPENKWGFLVNNKLLRPLKYFHKFGHH